MFFLALELLLVTELHLATRIDRLTCVTDFLVMYVVVLGLGREGHSPPPVLLQPPSQFRGHP